MSALTEQEIFDAIDAQLLTLSNIDTPNVAFLGRAYQPEATTPYMATSMPVLKNKNLTLGTSVIQQWEGVYQVDCRWPIGSGLQSMTQQMAAVRALFPNGQSLVTSGGFTIRFYKAFTSPPRQDGAWLTGIVTASWFAFETQPP